MRDIVFLQSDRHRGLGSNILRAQQLCAICQAGFSGEDARFTLSDTAADLAGAVLFLTKGFLIDTNPDELRRLKQRGNRLCADFLDMRVVANLVPHLDVLVASSMLQERFYGIAFPGKPVVHVTHHVDLRVTAPPAQGGAFRCAYFGDPANAAWAAEIRMEIDIVPATSPTDRGWIDRLSAYTCHYAIRRSRPWDGFKPFTKGFLAARCGAPVIVAASDQEATLQLGEDYPYRCRVPDAAAAVAAIRQVRESYGGCTWRRAATTMQALSARVAMSAVQAELRRLLLD